MCSRENDLRCGELGLQMNKRPNYCWVNAETIRFAFKEQISLENRQLIHQFERFIQQYLEGHIVETVSSYHTLTVFLRSSVQLHIERLLDEWVCFKKEEIHLSKGRINLPVCYDEEFALDMGRVMEATDLSAEEIIRIHSERSYTVFLMGFLPGFPYLGVLDERLHVPRLQVPRQLVVASSVGIGGAQTGIYPIDSPGGWNIIGRTPFQLFDVKREKPFLLAPGDEIHFVKIDKGQFNELKKGGMEAWSLY